MAKPESSRKGERVQGLEVEIPREIPEGTTPIGDRWSNRLPLVAHKNQLICHHLYQWANLQAKSLVDHLIEQ